MGVDIAKIKTLRTGSNLSMAEAAKLAGMSSAQQWNSIESGHRSNPSIDTVQRIAKALKVTVNDIVK